MKILNEDKENISIEFTNSEYDTIKNLILNSNNFNIQSLCNEYELDCINHFVFIREIESDIVDEYIKILSTKIELEKNLDVTKTILKNSDSIIDFKSKGLTGQSLDYPTYLNKMKERLLDALLNLKSQDK